MLLSAKDLLQELVRIPSVNPAFLSGDTGFNGESQVTDYLQVFFRDLGWEWLRQVVHPGRDNIVVVCRATGAAARQRPVLWEVHQDTVGVAGMKIDPFAAVESEGRIWGRGACDVKGGMAAMLAALARVEAEGAALQQTIVLALAINEECGFTGVKALCRLWGTEAEAAAEAENLSGPLSLAELRELRPARAIVAEPTLLDVVVAHKGSVRWRCHTHGRAAHTSRPEQGCNAISTMVRVVQAIEQFHAEVLSRRAAHALCGRPTVCVSMIQGGSGVNTVPHHAVIDIDRRLVPGETPEDAYQELVDYVADYVATEVVATEVVATEVAGSAATIEHERPTNPSFGLEDDANRDWAEQIAATVQSLGEPSGLIGVPFGTDAWALAAAGIPTVVFGPGSIDQAHTDDEWIDIGQLERATEIFYRLACGV